MDEIAVQRVIDWYHTTRNCETYDKDVAEFRLRDSMNALRQFIMNASVVPGRPWVWNAPRAGAIKVDEYYFIPRVLVKLGHIECEVNFIEQLNSVGGQIPPAFIDLSRKFGWYFANAISPFYEAISSASHFSDRFIELKQLTERELYRQKLEAGSIVSDYDRTLGDDLIRDLKPDLKETLVACERLRSHNPEFITKVLHLGLDELQEVVALLKRRANEIEVVCEDVIQEVLDPILISDVMSQ